MEKYLYEIFGNNFKIKKWDGYKKLPLFLRNKREYYVLSIGEYQALLMKNNSDVFHVSNFEKEMRQIEEYAKMTVVLWLDAVSTYQRNALIKSKISFIVPNSQFFAPELGICLKEFCAGKAEKVEKISAISQFLLLYFIYLKQPEEKSQSELAQCLGLSDMNISRAVKELQELEFVKIRNDKTSKKVQTAAIGKELYEMAEKYLQSPVQKKIYVDQKGFDMHLPLAGETALAKRSILNFPKHMVYALDKKCFKDIAKEILVEPKLMKNNDYVEIELWKYNPSVFSVDGMVDIISLVQSLKDIDDERIEMQIKEVLEDYKW